MGVIRFNGVSSEDLRVQVQTAPGYVAPERDYNITHVPGRNGDVVIDQGSWQNVDKEYSIAIYDPNEIYTDLVASIIGWLHSANGYARLEDSYEPDYYRMAMYKDSVEVETMFLKAGAANIKFNCKPQRYLKDGERVRKYTSSATIYNPTDYTAEPLIEISFVSSPTFPITLNINGEGVQIGKSDGTYYTNNPPLIIDSYAKDCYYSSFNLNPYVTFSTTGEFPTLDPGENNITFVNNAASIEYIKVTPRWFVI